MVFIPRKNKRFSAVLSVALAAAMISSTVCWSLGAAQKNTIGQITVVYKHFTYNGSTFTAEGGVTVTSKSFNIVAQTVVLYFEKGVPGVSRATAEGNTATGSQVVGQFDQTAAVPGEQDRTFKFLADKAVYTPDLSRPNGGTVDFTGHVTLTVLDPSRLAEPSITHMNHATVTLGSGPDYPIIDGDEGTTEFTPRPDSGPPVH